MTESRTYQVPVPFDGTIKQSRRNFMSHQFGGIDGRCFDCDNRPTNLGALYPCGAEVPRRTVRRELS